MSVIMKLIGVWEKLRDDSDKMLDWLTGIESVDSTVKVELLPFFYGLVMERNKGLEAVVLRVLKIVVDLVEFKNDIAVEFLPILLYKIANDKSPLVKMECLKALPLMAKTKVNFNTFIW